MRGGGGIFGKGRKLSQDKSFSHKNYEFDIILAMSEFGDEGIPGEGRERRESPVAKDLNAPEFRGKAKRGPLTGGGAMAAAAAAQRRQIEAAQARFYGLPEVIPTSRLEWISAAREQLLKYRYSLESVYSQTTWPQKMETFISMMPRVSVQDKETAEKLISEATLMQDSYRLRGIVRRHSQSGEGMKSLPNTLSELNIDFSPRYFNRFVDLPETEVPAHLRRSIGKKEVSMSECVDRSMWVMAFLGEWVDMQEKALKAIEVKVGRRAVTGEFGGDPKIWDRTVGDLMERERAEILKGREMKRAEEKYTRYLNLGKNGLIDGGVLRQTYATMPGELRHQVELDPKFKEVLEKAGRGEKMGLSQLFAGKNIFCEDTNTFEIEYLEWLVGGLVGSKYAVELARDVIEGTLEGTAMNTTEASFGLVSDSVTHLMHPDIRQAAEGKKGAPVGSSHVAGRYPPVLRSFLRSEKIDKVSILDRIRIGERFTRLPWYKLSRDPGGGYWGISFSRGMAVFDAISSPEVDVDKLTEEGLKGLVKPTNTAWGDWGKDDRRINMTVRERGGSREPTLWEMRDRWSELHLTDAKNVHKVRIKDLKGLGGDGWSPWVAWAVGVCYEHHPIGALLPDELKSPIGVAANRAAAFKGWSYLRTATLVEGVGSTAQVKSFNQRSLPEFLDDLTQGRLLTYHEAILVREIVKSGRAANWGIIQGGTMNMFDWKPPLVSH